MKTNISYMTPALHWRDPGTSPDWLGCWLFHRQTTISPTSPDPALCVPEARPSVVMSRGNADLQNPPCSGNGFTTIKQPFHRLRQAPQGAQPGNCSLYEGEIDKQQ